MFNVHFAQRISQYYFVLQSSHKVRPSTTSYHKTHTKYSQYYFIYFVLQSLHKVRQKSQFYLSFWRSTSISCERVEIDYSKSQFYLSFWRSTSISCERVEIDYSKSQFYLSFWRSTMFDVHFVRKGWNRLLKIAILPQFLTFDDVRRPFRAKWSKSTTQNRNFTSVFDARRSFRAKGLRFVAVRRHRPRLKRERKKSERETYSEREKRSADM